MMTAEEKKRVDWHLNIPACRVLRGVKLHLSLVSIDELVLLCRHFACGIGELTDRMWEHNGGKRNTDK